MQPAAFAAELKSFKQNNSLCSKIAAYIGRLQPLKQDYSWIPTASAAGL